MITFTILEFAALGLVILNSILIVKSWKDHKHIRGLEMFIEGFMEEMLEMEDGD